MAAATAETFDGTSAYLDLLKLWLTGLTLPSGAFAAARQPDGTKLIPVTPETIADIKRRRAPWLAASFTMMGLDRTNHLQACVEDVLAHDIPGDMIETGVWRGGATILMRALLAIHGVTDRSVVVADSFQGVPPPDAEAFPIDASSRLHTFDALAVPIEFVKDNFARFGLLDDQVEFVPGRFRDTLPALSDRVWSVVRLDGDLYESTINALDSLYSQLSPGGYLIVDDYGALEQCREAVRDYRSTHAIEEEIRAIDGTGVYWQKEA